MQKRIRLGIAVLTASVAFAGAVGALAASFELESGDSLDCPALGSYEKEWGEYEGRFPPQDVVARHLALPVSQVVPMNISAQMEHFWVGLSYRSRMNGRAQMDPGCFLTGSAAYYIVGSESNPEYDFVGTISGGGENTLGERLVEMRWFDARLNKRVRWINRKLADSLGWYTDGRGERHEGDQPIPLPQDTNALH